MMIRKSYRRKYWSFYKRRPEKRCHESLLAELSIKNFAIIEELTVSFEKGLTVLTGETGAGKSIIIDAVATIEPWRQRPRAPRPRWVSSSSCQFWAWRSRGCSAWMSSRSTAAHRACSPCGPGWPSCGA
ncbi:AAA family ATPase, partial [Bacillaceae bacterium HSR45]|nr:AAA family ATPase [Bacillaceae bacterium HSR45]